MYTCIMGHIVGSDPNAKCKICSGDKEYIGKLPVREYRFNPGPAMLPLPELRSKLRKERWQKNTSLARQH